MLLLPYPSHGYVHPLLQFAKPLAHRGLRPALAVTRATSSPRSRTAATRPGSPSARSHRLPGPPGAETLDELLRTETAGLYDAFLPWARGVMQRHGARQRGLLHPAVHHQSGVWPR